MKKKFVTFGAVFCAALLLSACGAGETSENGAPAPAENYTVTLTETAHESYTSLTEMLKAIRPTVVDVTSYTETGTSLGSGVIIGGAGGENGAYEKYFIVTNHHVIDGGSSFYVDVLSLEGDEETTTVYEATLIGSSMKRDIAVLSVTPPAGTVLKAAAFVSDSNAVAVGTEVYAIGNPLGILGGTVTHGIVSATKRDVNVGEIGTMTLMQTDALINGGNSGGGLFDSSGALVGIINSGYDTYNGQYVEGLNFAIPANDAKYAAECLIQTHEEAGGEVTKYGYVEGDARVDITFSLATLYTSSALSSRANYLVAAASSESPLYSEWGNAVKAVVAITVNGERTDFTESGGGSYTLTDLANDLISRVGAGDEVTVTYKNVLQRSAGFFGSYSYVDGASREVSFTALQYIYTP